MLRVGSDEGRYLGVVCTYAITQSDNPGDQKDRQYTQRQAEARSGLHHHGGNAGGQANERAYRHIDAAADHDYRLSQADYGQRNTLDDDVADVFR